MIHGSHELPVVETLSVQLENLAVRLVCE